MEWRRPALLCLSLSALLVPGCALYPDDNEPPKEDVPARQFAAADYSYNAKQYYDGGDFNRAKDQWTKQLELEPQNWMAKLGIAFCDLYLSHESVLMRRDVGAARAQVQTAEKEFRDLWNGTIEPDAVDPTNKEPQWRAALGVALATRHLGYLDQLDATSYTALASRGGAEAQSALGKAAESTVRRDRNYAASIAIFQKLAAQQHATPEATKNLGELYIVTRQDALAERELRRYLQMARATREKELEPTKEKIAKNFDRDQQETAMQFIDSKLNSNSAKQVSVLVDLAQLAWARGEYHEAKRLMDEAITIEPDRRDLYLKLGEAEGKLQMYETGLQHLDEFLRRSSQKREEYDEDIHTAMRLRKEFDAKLTERAKASPGK